MNGSRFDLWTRRRFGMAAGAITARPAGLAAALGLAATETAQAGKRRRKRKKRKRCIKLLKPCRVGGRRCCRQHVCQSFDTGANGTFFCCKGPGAPCSTSQQCCPPAACQIETGATAGLCAAL